MANSFNTQILRDGHRNFVIRLTGSIDTPTGFAAPAALTSISTMNPPCLALRVDRVKYSLPHGCPLDVQLWWQATTNILFEGMSGGDDGEFWNFGGLTNNAGAGVTGNIMWSVVGDATASATNILVFAVILECVKLKVQYPL